MMPIYQSKLKLRHLVKLLITVNSDSHIIRFLTLLLSVIHVACHPNFPTIHYSIPSRIVFDKKRNKKKSEIINCNPLYQPRPKQHVFIVSFQYKLLDEIQYAAARP